MATVIRYKELVGGTGKKQNWKGLGIAFVVIAIICFFIIAAIFLTNTRAVVSTSGSVPLSEKDVFNIKVPKPWNGTWISDRHFSYIDENESLWIYNCDILQTELIFDRNAIQVADIGYGILSPSGRYILMQVNDRTVHRYYTEYRYDLYERHRKIVSITHPNGTNVLVSTVAYSNSDNYFAFVHNFDVYVYDVAAKQANQVTFDGNRTTVHNGLVEWNYEYEIFKQHQLLFWSPDNRYLAFIKIDLRSIKKYHFLKYDLSLDNNDEYSIPYPKYGDKLPLLEVYIYNVKSNRLLRVPRPIQSQKKSDVYVHHVVWYCDTCLSVVYGTRDRNSSTIQLYQIETTTYGNETVAYRSSFVETTRVSTLVTRFLKPYFSPMGTYGFIIRFGALKSGKSGGKHYPHIVRIHFNQTAPQIVGVSPPDIVTDEIIHIDKMNHLYFTGFLHNNPLERQVYRWNYMSDASKLECLSCQYENASCDYANARFSSSNGSYFILECYGSSIPFSTLHNQTTKLALINNNQPFRDWIKDRMMPFVDYFSVPLDNENTLGHGMIILPPGYNPNVTIASHPVIVSINDRIHEQRVTKKYSLPLLEFAHVTQENISIVIFDPHGSTGQDESYLKNYPNWFERQYEDYIKLATHLKYHEKKFNNTLNATKFGLKAQGPGAIIALKLLDQSQKHPNQYVCAFLESPVIDLSNYHAVYTERISGVKTYAKSSHRSDTRNSTIAIVHGTANEDVHFKHSAALAKTFLADNTDFRFKVYPDVDHDFSRNSKIHNDFYRFQRGFFQECLGSRVNKERKLIIPEEHE